MQAKEDLAMGKKVRTLSEEQREKLRAFIEKTTVRVSEGAFGDKTYKEIIAEGKSADYEALESI